MDGYITIAQLAELRGVSSQAISNAISRGRIPADMTVKDGTNRLISVSVLSETELKQLETIVSTQCDTGNTETEKALQELADLQHKIDLLEKIQAATMKQLETVERLAQEKEQRRLDAEKHLEAVQAALSEAKAECRERVKQAEERAQRAEEHCNNLLSMLDAAQRIQAGALLALQQAQADPEPQTAVEDVPEVTDPEPEIIETDGPQTAMEDDYDVGVDDANVGADDDVGVDQAFMPGHEIDRDQDSRLTLAQRIKILFTGRL